MAEPLVKVEFADCPGALRMAVLMVRRPWGWLVHTTGIGTNDDEAEKDLTDQLASGREDDHG